MKQILRNSISYIKSSWEVRIKQMESLNQNNAIAGSYRHSQKIKIEYNFKKNAVHK